MQPFFLCPYLIQFWKILRSKSSDYAVNDKSINLKINFIESDEAVTDGDEVIEEEAVDPPPQQRRRSNPVSKLTVFK